MTIRVTITAAGVVNEYGQALAIGTVYTPVNDDYALALISQGRATDTDEFLEERVNAPFDEVVYPLNPVGMSSDGTSLVSGDGTPINLTPSGLWATRATLAAAGVTSAFFTDVGVGGSFWFYSGGRWRPSAGRVVLKNLISSVTHSTTVRTVMDYATILAGLWQDGDVMEMEWCKTLTAGSESDTTETGLGTAPTTFGEAMNLTTAALNGATPILMVAARWRWRRLGPTSVRPISVTGSTGLGGAGSVVADPTITTNLDTTESYLQISGDLSAGLGPVTALRAFTVTLIAGA